MWIFQLYYERHSFRPACKSFLDNDNSGNNEVFSMRIIQWFKDKWRGVSLSGLRNPDWSKIRNIYLQKNPYCEICGSKKKLEIHHIAPVHIDKTKELVFSNLITACREHHYFICHLNSWKSWNTEVKNDAQMWYNKIQQRP